MQHVDNGRHLGALAAFVDVGENRQAELLLHFAKNPQAFVHAKTAERLARTAIGLVVRRFIDEGHAHFRADFLQAAGDVDRHLLRLDHARARDQEERLVETDLEITQLHACAPTETATAGAGLASAVTSGCTAA